jgi:hypothetical protein
MCVPSPLELRPCVCPGVGSCTICNEKCGLGVCCSSDKNILLSLSPFGKHPSEMFAGEACAVYNASAAR